MEGRHCFEHLTVEENLLTGAYTRSNNKEVKDDLERVYNYFPRLRDRRTSLAGYTSGGEQQMLSISRALGTKPAILLLDELSMGLAPIIVKDLYQIVYQLSQEGIAVLVVEQFARTVLGVSNKAGIMINGKIVREGEPNELEEQLSAAYLGKKSSNS